jgi:hypothetical protein
MAEQVPSVVDVQAALSGLLASMIQKGQPSAVVEFPNNRALWERSAGREGRAGPVLAHAGGVHNERPVALRLEKAIPWAISDFDLHQSVASDRPWGEYRVQSCGVSAISINEAESVGRGRSRQQVSAERDCRATRPETKRALPVRPNAIHNPADRHRITSKSSNATWTDTNRIDLPALQSEASSESNRSAAASNNAALCVVTTAPITEL